MRSVKVRPARSKRAGQGSRRTSRGSRTSNFRPEKRSRGYQLIVAAAEHPVFEKLRANFFVQRPMLGLTVLLAASAGMMGLFGGGHVSYALRNTGGSVQSGMAAMGFAVHGVSLSGNERTSPNAAYAALGIKQDEFIFSIDPDTIRTRLKQLPWVADAIVRRRLPDVIAVRLIEKRPFALWSRDGDFLVVERSGAVIQGANSEGLDRLPVLVGDGAPEAAPPLVDALSGYRALSQRLAAIARIGDRRWDLLLSGGVTVRLPEQNWEAELGELEKLIVDKGVLERDIEMIDLRYPDNYVFRLHNGDSRPVPRERRA